MNVKVCDRPSENSQWEFLFILKAIKTTFKASELINKDDIKKTKYQKGQFLRYVIKCIHTSSPDCVSSLANCTHIFLLALIPKQDRHNLHTTGMLETSLDCSICYHWFCHLLLSKTRCLSARHCSARQCLGQLWPYYTEFNLCSFPHSLQFRQAIKWRPCLSAPNPFSCQSILKRSFITKLWAGAPPANQINSISLKGKM